MYSSYPISLFHRPNRLVWHFHKLGVYTVKSGYYVARDIMYSRNHKAAGLHPSAAGNMEQFGKSIWCIPLPMKLAIFF